MYVGADGNPKQRGDDGVEKPFGQDSPITDIDGGNAASV